MLRNRIYAFVYGAEGSGKTRLAMSLANPDGYGVSYITPESSGPTSLISAGYPKDIPVEVLPPSGEDPFEPCIAAIEDFAADKSITTICIDGCTVICGRAVDHLSGGEGEKALGWDGWGQVLNGFRQIEAACERANRAGKSIILTAWENPPQYEDTMGGRVLKDGGEGRPLLQGKAATWLPGNCDIVARITSTFKTVNVNGKAERKFQAQLQVNRRNDWLAKSRWPLPDPCPANLKEILRIVSGGGTKPKTILVPAKKKVAVK